jgi:hypothetical protein
VVSGPLDDPKTFQERNRGAADNQTEGSWFSIGEQEWGFNSISSTIIVLLSAEKK